MKKLDDFIIFFFIFSMILFAVALGTKTSISTMNLPRFCPKGWCKKYETSKVLKCTRCLQWNNDTLIINKKK